MNSQLNERITQVVAVAGVAMVIVAYLLWGADAALGAFGGALVAMANWGVIRWVSTRVTDQHVTGRGRLFGLLGVKTAALMGVCWLLLTRVGLDPKGFMVGIGALVIGITVGPLTVSEKSSADSNNRNEEQEA